VGKDAIMNGCKYCVIMHHRKRHGKRRARGVAMCLAQEELLRCQKKWDERGPGCEFHDAKVLAAAQEQAKPAQMVIYAGKPRRQKQDSVPMTAR
jgi:hypothetical protein